MSTKAEFDPKDKYKKIFDLVVKDIHETGKSIRSDYYEDGYNDIVRNNKDYFRLKSQRFTFEEMQKLINAIYYYYEGCYLKYLRVEIKPELVCSHEEYEYNHPRVVLKRFIRWNKYEDILMFRLWCVIGGDSNNFTYNDDFYTIEETLTRAVKQRNILQLKRMGIEPPQVEDNPNPCCTIM